ncbi:MAG TPA: alanine racemase [Solirubrobacteraceae bacterium]|nr:alanine racemase [Solirubrobacteraceae bacterium]
MALRAVAEVNLAAIERNVRTLGQRLGAATLCAVVKADAYGHGAAPVARAALGAGARQLAVATAGEAAELRAAGITAPVLVMGALGPEELATALEAEAEIVAWDRRFLEDLAARARTPVRVHVKLDSGMGRLGTRDTAAATRVVQAIQTSPGLILAGLMTHFATSDGDIEFAAEQLRTFRAWADGAAPPSVPRHAANSGAVLHLPAAHLDMARCGIALYGGDPASVDPDPFGLEPALALRSYVAAVKPILPGQSAGYGRRFIAGVPTYLATLPIGYGDGLGRALTNNCDVLIGGRRYPLVGTVSMDNITVDVGPEPTVRVGETATLIGRDGDERQTAEDLARRVGTINYEVLCAISARVPRRWHRDGAPA